jgi:glycosyltransferase involved in cell wall biosynthesis
MRITIGLPCYNAVTTLRAAMRSILQQTFTDWELIAIDDGSTDGTAAVLREFRDPRIRLILDRENLGLSVRLNQILEMAQTDLIARMDADDLMHPLRLECQLRTFTDDPATEVAVCGAWVIDNQNRLLGARPVPESFHTPAGVLRGNGPIHATMLARREWLRLHPYNAVFRRGEDLDMWTRAIPSSRLAVLRERLYFIREPADFDLAKYAITLADHRRVFRVHGPACGGWPFTLRLFAASYLKHWIYKLSDLVGLRAVLARRRRAIPLEPEEHAALQSIIDRVAYV